MSSNVKTFLWLLKLFSLYDVEYKNSPQVTESMRSTHTHSSRYLYFHQRFTALLQIYRHRQARSQEVCVLFFISSLSENLINCQVRENQKLFHTQLMVMLRSGNLMKYINWKLMQIELGARLISQAQLIIFLICQNKLITSELI